MAGRPAIMVAREAANRLAETGSDAPQLEAELLMAESLGWSRAALLARWRDHVLTQDEERRWEALLARRLAGEPLAYIMGRREFYGIDLKTDGRALIPRPETEMLVEAALDWCRMHQAERIADIGTGSGAIAVALALHLPAQIFAVDISPDALALAEENASRAGVAGKIRFYRGDLAAALPFAVDCIVANLPYIGDAGMADLAPQITEYEPHMALYGGPTGLDLYRRLFQQIAGGQGLHPGGGLFCETAADNGQAALELAQELLPGGDWKLAYDMAGHCRMVYCEAVPVLATRSEKNP